MMHRFTLFMTLLIVWLLACATAQDAEEMAEVEPFVWPENYAATMPSGGILNEIIFGDFTTLNPALISNAAESAVIGSLTAGPSAVYRDWLGTRAFKNEDGAFNMMWAKDIEEIVPDKEYVITLRKGWKWSDGTEMTTADIEASWMILGDSDVESNDFACSVVDEEPVEYVIIDRYTYSFHLPKAQVNALAVNNCPSFTLLPAHVFMPAYEEGGAEAVKALWGVDTDPSEMVFGGPFVIAEFKPGERLVLERNPIYGEFVKAADGSPMGGVDSWVVTLTEDENQVLASVITGQADFYWPSTLDQVRAVKEALDSGAITGRFDANIGPDGLVDFITYNFNNTDNCKRDMFSNQVFRQAIAIMIDRDAIVQAAVGGLGFPAKDWVSDSAKPFNSPHIEPFVFDPEAGVEMLASIGYSAEDDDGVLMNPDSGCRVEFDLQYNSGNNRRSQEALVISQTVAPYGVKINPREVSTEIWANSIVGDLDYDETGERTTDYDAQIWGLAGGDVDNPSFRNGFRINVNLNSWNKSKENVEPWEEELDALTVSMNQALDLDERVAIFNERATLLREYLPLTPLISPAFHVYTDAANIWPVEDMDANSIESPYRPGTFRSTMAVTEGE